MKTTTKKRRPKGPILGPDGYEDTPPYIEAAMEAGLRIGPLPADFLPPPDQFILRKPKKPMTIRIDQDVLEWYQSLGKGYQTIINAILKSYKEAQEKG